jgi:hypothetical protein
MVIAVVNHYQLQVQPFFLSLSLVSYYTISLHHVDDNFFTLWSFSTQKLQVWKLVTIVDFATHFTNFESTWSFQLSMTLMHLTPFQWSIAGLDIAKTTQIYEPCQGKFYHLHSLSFQQLKHIVQPYSLNPFHVDSWNIKVLKSITLDDGNRRRFTRMHTTFLCNFSKYASCDSPNTPFLLSRRISIHIVRDIRQ